MKLFLVNELVTKNSLRSLSRFLVLKNHYMTVGRSQTGFRYLELFKRDHMIKLVALG